jgi:transposase-like protein
MRFIPPRCPNRSCPQHRDPQPGFFTRQGAFRARCRKEAVPRFRCSTCRKGFSRQTFRADYRDRRPDLNVRVLQMLVSGVGLRQTAREVGIGVHAVQNKFRKHCRVLRGLNRNLLRRLPPGRTFLLDELETFEDLSILPVTVPVLIEKQSKLVVATGAAPIRRVRKKGSQRQRWLQRYEQEHGKRQDLGRASVTGAFVRFRHLLAGARATLLTDEKALYGSLCRRLLGGQVAHQQFSSLLPRDTKNPLFAINHTDAMLRDNCGRLRRRSWLVSKKAKYLRLQLELFTAYRNWHRKRANDDEDGLTPGVVLELVPRRLEWHELLAWRQDWRQRSIHPASTTGRETVLEAAA